MRTLWRSMRQRKHLPSGAFVDGSGWSDGQPCLVVSGIEIDEAVEVSEQAATALSKHIQRPVAEVARDLLRQMEGPDQSKSRVR